MRLQWCHTNHQRIDSDIFYTNCVLSVALRFDQRQVTQGRRRKIMPERVRI